MPVTFQVAIGTTTIQLESPPVSNSFCLGSLPTCEDLERVLNFQDTQSRKAN
jgi:hypothetical protein